MDVCSNNWQLAIARIESVASSLPKSFVSQTVQTAANCQLISQSVSSQSVSQWVCRSVTRFNCKQQRVLITMHRTCHLIFDLSSASNPIDMRGMCARECVCMSLWYIIIYFVVVAVVVAFVVMRDACGETKSCVFISPFRYNFFGKNIKRLFWWGLSSEIENAFNNKPKLKC